MNSIKKFGGEAILSNQKIAEVEELLRVSHESNYRRMRYLKRAVTFARTSAARKAAECASCIREKAATSLQIARKMHRDDVLRRQREHDDACQQVVLNESRRLEAAMQEQHILDIDHAR